MVTRIALAASLLIGLAACQDDGVRSTRHLSPIPPATLALMSSKGMSRNDPILIRAYKKESELEVWKRGADGRYAHLKTYPICRWSGQLGPKVREGDRQAPEGFYTVTPALMNPNSSFYLSFDTGYPNAFDRAHGRTGSHLMVHGSCSSRGCFAMTDEAIAEVYSIARDAFGAGQRGFQFQSYPFRMTPENLAKHRADPHIAFWKNLKEGSDHFEATGEEPRVAVCAKRYVFGGADVESCAPAVPPAVVAKRERDEQKVAELVAKGTPAVRVVYADGGQHASFRDQPVTGDNTGAFAVLNSRPQRNLGDVSRPEALAYGPQEVVIEPGKPAAKETATASKETATAKPAAVAAKPAPKPEPAGANGGRTVVASAGEVPATVVAKPVLPEETPAYRRMLASVFGSADTSTRTKVEPAAAVSPPVPKPDAPKAAEKPRPEKKAERARPGQPKPEKKGESRAESPPTIPGAQPVPGTTSGFVRAN
jgi:murein L,D-transpeptidase YafK